MIVNQAEFCKIGNVQPGALFQFLEDKDTDTYARLLSWTISNAARDRAVFEYELIDNGKPIGTHSRDMDADLFVYIFREVVVAYELPEVTPQQVEKAKYTLMNLASQESQEGATWKAWFAKRWKETT